MVLLLLAVFSSLNAAIFLSIPLSNVYIASCWATTSLVSDQTDDISPVIVCPDSPTLLYSSDICVRCSFFVSQRRLVVRPHFFIPVSVFEQLSTAVVISLK